MKTFHSFPGFFSVTHDWRFSGIRATSGRGVLMAPSCGFGRGVLHLGGFGEGDLRGFDRGDHLRNRYPEFFSSKELSRVTALFLYPSCSVDIDISQCSKTRLIKNTTLQSSTVQLLREELLLLRSITSASDRIS